MFSQAPCTTRELERVWLGLGIAFARLRAMLQEGDTKWEFSSLAEEREQILLKPPRLTRVPRRRRNTLMGLPEVLDPVRWHHRRVDLASALSATSPVVGQSFRRSGPINPEAVKSRSRCGGLLTPLPASANSPATASTNWDWTCWWQTSPTRQILSLR